MPFVSLQGGQVGPTKTEIELTQLAPDARYRGTNFRVESSFAWVDETGDEPRPGDCVDGGPTSPPTDLASIPPFLWGLIASYGTHTMTAILHDRKCDAAKGQRDRRHGALLRREADALFRHSLRVHASFLPATRWIMWSAVRMFGSAWIGLALVLGVVVGMLHWSTALLASVAAALDGVTMWPWLSWLEVLPSAIGAALSWLSGLVAGDARFAWTLLGLGLLTLGLMVNRSVERKEPGGPAAFSAKAFVDLVWAGVIGALVAPPLLPLVIVTLVSRTLLWVVDVLFNLLRRILLAVASVLGQDGRLEDAVDPREQVVPPFPGFFPKP